MSTKRMVLKFIAAVLTSLLLFLLVAEFAGWPFLRHPAENLLSRSLHRSVSFKEPFAIHFLGGIRLSSAEIKIDAPEGFDLPYFFQAKQLDVSLRYSDLIHITPTSPYQVKALSVEDLDARLIRNASGLATWDFDEDKQTSRPFPLIEQLKVAHGQITLQDMLNQAYLTFLLSTQEGELDAHPTSKIEVSGKYKNYPLKAAMQTDGFLPIATKFDTDTTFNSKGWLDYKKIHAEFDGSLSDLLGRQNVSGKLLVSGASLALFGELVGVTLPTTGSFNLIGEIKKKDALWSADISHARVGSSDLAGEFIYDSRLNPPVLSGKLHGKRFVLADLAPAFGTRNQEGQAVQPKDGRTIPDRPLDLPSLNRMDADIKVDLVYVDLGSAFSKPIAPLRANLKIEQGRLSLSHIQASTAAGSIVGDINVDAHMLADNPDNVTSSAALPVSNSGAVPLWGIDLKWQNINLQQWLKISDERKRTAQESHQDSAEPAYVTGTLNGSTKLSGQGKSTASLMASLNGDMSFYIRQGTISHLLIELMGLDIAQSVGLVLGGDQSLPMQCAVVSLKASKGVMTPNLALVDTPVTTVLIDGNVDMASENLNLRLLAKPKNFSPLTLRSPIRVTGTFANPDATPEAGPIATKVISSVLLALLNPLASILPLLDTGDKPDHLAESSCMKSLASLEKKYHQKNSVN